MITKLTRYRFDFDPSGTHRTLAEINAYVENGIGKVIDATSIPLGPRERLAVMDALLAHRDDLTTLLQLHRAAGEIEHDDQ